MQGQPFLLWNTTMKKLISIALGVSLLGLAGCATEGSRVVESQKVNTYDTPYHG